MWDGSRWVGHLLDAFEIRHESSVRDGIDWGG